MSLTETIGFSDVFNGNIALNVTHYEPWMSLHYDTGRAERRFPEPRLARMLRSRLRKSSHEERDARRRILMTVLRVLLS